MAEQKTDNPSFKVVYYTMGGRAEPLRYAAAIGGLSFEDVFINFAQQGKDKKEGKRRWSGPPEVVVLDKDGKEVTTIAQSNSCLRYIGKLAGLYPDNPLQAALVDEILDSIEDLASVVAPAFKASADKKEEVVKKLTEEGGDMRYWLQKLLNRVEERKTGLLVGKELTIAELKFAAGMKLTKFFVFGGKDGILAEEKYKPLIDIVNKVDGNENVKKYEEQFKKNVEEFKKQSPENGPFTLSFKYNGKCVPGSL